METAAFSPTSGATASGCSLISPFLPPTRPAAEARCCSSEPTYRPSSCSADAPAGPTTDQAITTFRCPGSTAPTRFTMPEKLALTPLTGSKLQDSFRSTPSGSAVPGLTVQISVPRLPPAVR